jgi:hypothetical protein
MVTSQAIIDRMNNMTSTVIIDEASPTITTNVTPEAQSTPETRGISSEVEDAFNTQQPADIVDVASPINDEAVDVVEEVPVEPETVETQGAEVETAPARRSARIAQGITPPERYLL